MKRVLFSLESFKAVGGIVKSNLGGHPEGYLSGAKKVVINSTNPDVIFADIELSLFEGKKGVVVGYDPTYDCPKISCCAV